MNSSSVFRVFQCVLIVLQIYSSVFHELETRKTCKVTQILVGCFLSLCYKTIYNLLFHLSCHTVNINYIDWRVKSLKHQSGISQPPRRRGVLATDSDDTGRWWKYKEKKQTEDSLNSKKLYNTSKSFDFYRRDSLYCY